MQDFSAFAMGLGMVAAILLVVGGIKLALAPQTRGKGVLMIAAALVIVMNVMIWTV